MPLNTAKLDDFSGGINAIDDPIDLEGNELVYGATVDVEFIGHGKGLKVRRLHTLLQALAAPTGQTNWVASMTSIRATTATTDSIIMSTYGGRIDVYSLAAGTLVNRLAAAGGTDKLWFFEQMADNAGVQKCYCSNGVSTPQSYNIDTPAATVNWAGAPPNGTCLKSWKNMMMVGGVAAQPQRLYYSKINDPETFTAPGGFIDIKSTDDENDRIVGLEVIGENLLVFKQNSVWLVFDSVTFDNRRIANFGIANAWAKCIMGDRVFFSTNEGVYSTDGDTVRNESLNIQGRDVGGGAFSFNTNFSSARMASTSDGKVIMTFGHVYQVGWWILDTRIQRPDKQYAWLFHQANVNYTSAMCTATSAGSGYPVKDLYWIYNDVNATQALYKAFTKTSGSSDDSLGSVTGMFQSRRMALQGTENRERLRRVNIWGKGTISLTILDENSSGLFSANVVCPSGYRGFGRARPEIRNRFFSLWCVMNGYGPEVVEIELKYRGGKEH